MLICSSRSPTAISRALYHSRVCQLHSDLLSFQLLKHSFIVLNITVIPRTFAPAFPTHFLQDVWCNLSVCPHVFVSQFTLVTNVSGLLTFKHIQYCMTWYSTEHSPGRHIEWMFPSSFLEDVPGRRAIQFHPVHYLFCSSAPGLHTSNPTL